MRSIYEVLADKTSAAILAQITMSEGISASNISKNINIPQSTVYDHLRMLEKDQLIYSNEIKIKNFLKKIWYRTNRKTFQDTRLVKNKHYNTTFLANSKDISSRIRFSQALVRSSLVKLEEINNNDFIQFQKESYNPVFLKQLIINIDDYQYFLERIRDLEKELEQKNPESMKDRGSLLKEEKYFIFYFGIPDLEFIKKEK